jgi:hypothetical protein
MSQDLLLQPKYLTEAHIDGGVVAAVDYLTIQLYVHVY